MPDATEPLLQVHDLWFGYDRQAPVLKGIHLAIPAGDFIALTGPNGSGKTTLAKHFNGLLRPDRGQVALAGQDLRQFSTGEIARSVGYVFQNPDHQIFSATTRQEIAFGLHNLQLDEAEIRRRTDEALETFRLSPYAGRQPATLSYGLRRKISVASVLAMRPRALILDEPTTGLDWQSTAELVALLEDYHAQGNTIILITHDIRLIADHLPRCLVLTAGQVLAYGETRQVLKDPQVAQGAQLIFPQVTQLAQKLAPLGFRPDTLTVDEFCEQYRCLLRGINFENLELPGVNTTSELYVPGDSWAYRADPRVKLLLVVAIWTVLFAYHSLAVFMSALLLLHALYISAKIPRERILGIWKAFLPLLLLIPLLWAFFTPGGTALFELGPLHFSLYGFQQGLLLALRLVSMAFALLFWLYTTRPDIMVLGLVRLGLPYEWGLTFTLALHYIPAFQDLYRSISDAQQARGLQVAGSGIGRVRAMMPVFVPLVISLLRLSDQLGRALEARAFGVAGVRRTYLQEVRFQRSDYVYAGVILAVTLVLLAWRFT